MTGCAKVRDGTQGGEFKEEKGTGCGVGREESCRPVFGGRALFMDG